MAPDPDDRDRPDDGRPDPRDPSGRKLDEDAAWREIVANYGEVPDDNLTIPPPEPELDDPAPERPGPEDQHQRLQGMFRPAWDEPAETPATWDDEGHFVPPTPPPVTVSDPRRKAAWMGLFGSPLLMLVAVVLGWQLPDWVMFGLAMAFAGGFIYLVATMPNRRGDGSDDGAVV